MRFDPEFDRLNQHVSGQSYADTTSTSSTRPPRPKPKTPSHSSVDITFPPGTVAGLTLTANPKGPGVKVERLVRKDQAYKCGLRKGDTLISLNGVPCVHAPAAVALLEEATKASRSVKAVLLPKARAQSSTSEAHGSRDATCEASEGERFERIELDAETPTPAQREGERADAELLPRGASVGCAAGLAKLAAALARASRAARGRLLSRRARPEPVVSSLVVTVGA